MQRGIGAPSVLCLVVVVFYYGKLDRHVTEDFSYARRKKIKLITF